VLEGKLSDYEGMGYKDFAVASKLTKDNFSLHKGNKFAQRLKENNNLIELYDLN